MKRATSPGFAIEIKEDTDLRGDGIITNTTNGAPIATASTIREADEMVADALKRTKVYGSVYALWARGDQGEFLQVARYSATTGERFWTIGKSS
jgi:hypothetical protein